MSGSGETSGAEKPKVFRRHKRAETKRNAEAPDKSPAQAPRIADRPPQDIAGETTEPGTAAAQLPPLEPSETPAPAQTSREALMALAEDLTAPEDDPEREAEQETDPDTDDDAAEVQNFWGSDVDRDEANDEALDTADASTDVADSDVAEMDQDFAPGGHPPKSAQPATVEASDMSEPLADEPNARDAESLPPQAIAPAHHPERPLRKSAEPVSRPVTADDELDDIEDIEAAPSVSTASPDTVAAPPTKVEDLRADTPEQSPTPPQRSYIRMPAQAAQPPEHKEDVPSQDTDDMPEHDAPEPLVLSADSKLVTDPPEAQDAAPLDEPPQDDAESEEDVAEADTPPAPETDPLPDTDADTDATDPPAEEPTGDAPPRPDLNGWSRLGPVIVDERVLDRHRVITATRYDPAHAAFDVLRTRLLQAVSERGWSRIAITSPTKGCGKTFTAANLAISLARQENCRTILFDTDLRDPMLARTFGVSNVGSIGDMMRGRIAPEDHLRRLGPNEFHAGPNLAFAFNEAPETYASELLQDPRTSETLRGIEARFAPKLMLFDMPPALYGDDVLAMRPMIDAVILVVGGGMTTANEIREVENRLGTETPLLGVVLNRAEGSKTRQYGY
ncbi:MULTISPECIES: hypothetical protein [unclassified Roseivivax]|uniref:nucleotide-binding protein n=1 Tax=unclassified Roseivivax TaxID=2639302 RepID=UPI0020C76995|nr:MULTISPECIES: hypothetical protein [unclassified Roseivivax]